MCIYYLTLLHVPNLVRTISTISDCVECPMNKRDDQ